MARWELVTAHYIHTTELNEWEYTETDPASGKQVRKRYRVPVWLPEKSIVCQGRGLPGDIEFEGTPTPDMTPLDEEAEAISETFRDSWKQGEFGFGTDATMNSLGHQMGQAAASGNVYQPMPANVVSKEDFNRLQQQVAALMEEKLELKEQLEKRPARRM